MSNSHHGTSSSSSRTHSRQGDTTASENSNYVGRNRTLSSSLLSQSQSHFAKSNAEKLAMMSHLHSFASSSTCAIEAFAIALPPATLAGSPSPLGLRTSDEEESLMAADGSFLQPPTSNIHEEQRPLGRGDASEAVLITRDNANDDKPIPAKIMTVLCFVIFCEPVSLTILFPFIYFMVRDFGISSEKDVGFYVGFIASSFSLAQFMTSLLWGWVSDRVGRRPVLLIGLLGNSISLLMFGQAHSLQMAILSRMFCGFLNGNIGIAKCVIGEITTPKTQAFGFSLIGIMWSLGTIIGPVLGGCLANPVTQFPEWFDGNEFLAHNPYFLPCGISACVSFIGFLVGFFYMEETNPKFRQEGYIAVNSCQSEGQETGCGLLRDEESGLGKKKTIRSNEPRDSVQTVVEGEGSSSALEIEDSSQDCIHRDSFDSDINQSNLDNLDNLPQNAFGKAAVMNIIAYALLAFQNILLDEAFSLWIVTSPEDGGLGYDSAQVGVVLSIIGALALYMQLYLYPQLTRRYTPITLFRLGAILYMIPYLTYPILSGTINPSLENKTIVWLLLLLNLSIRQFCNVLTYTSVFILINNSATAENLGLINGIAQTSASFVRSIGPALGGIMWAWSITNGLGFPFNYWFVFMVIFVWSIGLVVTTMFLPEDEGCVERREVDGFVGGSH